jgi:hypothetical protein
MLVCLCNDRVAPLASINGVPLLGIAQQQQPDRSWILGKRRWFADGANNHICWCTCSRYWLIVFLVGFAWTSHALTLLRPKGTNLLVVTITIIYNNLCKNSVLVGVWLVGKARHEPAQARFGASRTLARSKLARLGPTRFCHELVKEARLELGSSSVQLEQAREPSSRQTQWT